MLDGPEFIFFLILLPNILHEEFLSTAVDLENGWEAFLLDEDVFLRLLTLYVKETSYLFIYFTTAAESRDECIQCHSLCTYWTFYTYNERFTIYGGLWSVQEIYLTEAHTSKACVKNIPLPIIIGQSEGSLKVQNNLPGFLLHPILFK